MSHPTVHLAQLLSAEHARLAAQRKGRWNPARSA